MNFIVGTSALFVEYVSQGMIFLVCIHFSVITSRLLYV